LAYFAYCKADTPEPYVGEWNYTNPHSQGLCMKLKAGIRLDISYETIYHNGTRTATIISNNRTRVDGKDCQCENATLDQNETMALRFNKERTLWLYFTKDPQITKDEKGIKWLLYRIAFEFTYDAATFPGSTETGNFSETLSNNKTLAGIGTAFDRSFSCSKDSKMDITDRLKITFTNLRVQPFIGKTDFSTADHCAADHETTDLIPIIIGAALAALVIIVLIAYLIGRARANNTPNYDNMK